MRFATLRHEHHMTAPFVSDFVDELGERALVGQVQNAVGLQPMAITARDYWQVHLASQPYRLPVFAPRP